MVAQLPVPDQQTVDANIVWVAIVGVGTILSVVGGLLIKQMASSSSEMKSNRQASQEMVKTVLEFAKETRTTNGEANGSHGLTHKILGGIDSKMEMQGDELRNISAGIAQTAVSMDALTQVLVNKPCLLPKADDRKHGRDL